MTLLAGVAAQAATALENARLYQQLSGKAEDLSVLLELAEEATDGSLDAEITDGLAGLAKDLDEFELKIMIIGATLLLSFLATIIPAKRAGSLAPVDVLRYE